MTTNRPAMLVALAILESSGSRAQAPDAARTAWLHEVHDHWSGFVAMRFPTAEGFDIVYCVAPLTPACVP
jgi:hypothetical protein